MAGDDEELLHSMDLLTYLERNEPSEIVKVGSDTYSTREHDSLKISNGKWFWFSKGFGGYTALDYLIKVRGMPFKDAAELIRGCRTYEHKQNETKPKEKKKIILPEMSQSSKNALSYLINDRHIVSDVAEYFASLGYIREDRSHSNVIFLGFDNENRVRYASMRSCTDKRIFKECAGSEKEYSFRFKGEAKFGLHIFESAVDLMSYLSLKKIYNEDFKKVSCLSLGGISGSEKLPPAVARFLKDYPETETVFLHLDADAPGRLAAKNLSALLRAQGKEVFDMSPGRGKDVNDYLKTLSDRMSINKRRTMEVR